MKHIMHHDLSPELAKKAAVSAFDSYKQKFSSFNPTLTWKSDTVARASFSVMGKSLEGTIELQPSAIAFDLEVPFMMRAFKGKAIDAMDRELKTWVAKAKAGELD